VAVQPTRPWDHQLNVLAAAQLVDMYLPGGGGGGTRGNIDCGHASATQHKRMHAQMHVLVQLQELSLRGAQAKTDPKRPAAVQEAALSPHPLARVDSALAQRPAMPPRAECADRHEKRTQAREGTHTHTHTHTKHTNQHETNTTRPGTHILSHRLLSQKELRRQVLRCHLHRVLQSDIYPCQHDVLANLVWGSRASAGGSCV